jgi:hypothetical protein
MTIKLEQAFIAGSITLRPWRWFSWGKGRRITEYVTN